LRAAIKLSKNILKGNTKMKNWTLALAIGTAVTTTVIGTANAASAITVSGPGGGGSGGQINNIKRAIAEKITRIESPLNVRIDGRFIFKQTSLNLNFFTKTTSHNDRRSFRTCPIRPTTAQLCHYFPP
jgi:hypothetical protein